MHYTQILNRLQDVKPSHKENSWTAICPSHQDRAPSLSITLDFDDKLLIHCHAGCKIQSICSAIDIELKDLYPQQDPSPKANQPFRRSKIPFKKLYLALNEQVALSFHIVNAYQRGEITPQQHQEKILKVVRVLNKIKQEMD